MSTKETRKNIIKAGRKAVDELIKVAEENNFQFYDCGDPIIWLKSQVDHAMRRSEYKDDFTEWVKKRIQED